MHRWVRLKLEMGHRLQAFCREQIGPHSGADRLTERLDLLLARGDALNLECVRSRAERQASTAHRARLRAEIRDTTLVPLVSVMRLASRVAPGEVTAWRLPPFRASDQRFGVDARCIAEEARRARELLMRHGIPPAVAEDLLAQLAEWEAAGARQRATHHRAVGSRAALKAVAAEILEVATALKAILRRALAGDPRGAAALRSARHIPWPRTHQRGGRDVGRAGSGTGRERGGRGRPPLR